MEALKEIYKEIVTYTPPSYRGIDRAVDVSGIRDAILARFDQAAQWLLECRSAGIDIHDDSVMNEILYGGKEREDKPEDFSREERLLLLVDRVKEINVDDGTIIPCNRRIGEIGAYYKLSFEEFCSYLYWRTLVRKKRCCDAPIPFLELYLFELCNFVEFSTVAETHQMLLYLAESLTEKKAKSRVYDTLSDFLVYYGTEEDVRPYDTGIWGIQYIKECLQFIDGIHPAPFDFIAKKARHKIKKSPFYQENPTGIETQFMAFFSSIIQILRDNGVDLIPLWVGKCELIQVEENPFSLIKYVKQDFVVEKQFVEEDIVFRKVSKSGVIEARMTSLGETLDPGESIFDRKYVIDYPIKAFENELRKSLGKHPLKVSTQEMREMLNDGEKPLLSKIIEIYESDAFADCVKKSVKPLL